MLIRTCSIAAGLGVLAFAGVTAVPVLAQHSGQSNAGMPADAMSVSEVAARLEGQGYTVREIELENRVYEVEVTDADGLRLEAYVDPASGAFVDDDRYEDDD
jgi:uncharacterized membrane protein YkoI